MPPWQGAGFWQSRGEAGGASVPGRPQQASSPSCSRCLCLHAHGTGAYIDRQHGEALPMAAWQKDEGESLRDSAVINA